MLSVQYVIRKKRVGVAFLGSSTRLTRGAYKPLVLFIDSTVFDI